MLCLSNGKEASGQSRMRRADGEEVNRVEERETRSLKACGSCEDLALTLRVLSRRGGGGAHALMWGLTGSLWLLRGGQTVGHGGSSEEEMVQNDGG